MKIYKKKIKNSLVKDYSNFCKNKIKNTNTKKKKNKGNKDEVALTPVK